MKRAAGIARCRLCDKQSRSVSRELSLCLGCIREDPRALSVAMEAHRKSRALFGLPESPPKAPSGIACNICVHECRIPQGEFGYCGLRRNEGGRLRGAGAGSGKFSWYHDPLPTNCVAHWVCAAGTGAGFPQYAYRKGPEYGYKNLAVFFQACTLNCLFCQNWRYREETLKAPSAAVEELVSAIDEKTSCVCYFGGDPAPQLPFALRASKLLLRPAPPPLVASTLLVPGYIDEEEVSSIARFIAGLNTEIPYALLAFYPHFFMSDMPLTERAFALRRLLLAKKEGLKNVRIGNVGLLA
jgi:pyruvate-formate lyase-activating enzyme